MPRAAQPLAAALHPTQERIHEFYAEREEDWRRDHLGASVVGHKCDRYLWLHFRWAMPSRLEGNGRMQRLLERGKREEAWIIEDLKAIGCHVDENIDDERVVSWGHVGGSDDGIVTGLLEAPKTRHLLEVKTANLKRFNYLAKHGVKKAQPVHYVQMQLYMFGLKLERAFYVTVCKDNDELYTERVRFDREAAEVALGRAQSIVASSTPPDRMDPEYPPCKLKSKDGTEWPCDYWELCHGELMPERSCRTCVSSTPLSNRTWACVHHGESLSPDQQRSDWDCHMTIPQMTRCQVQSVNEEAREITFVKSNGEVVS